MSQISAHQDSQPVLDWIPRESVGRPSPMKIASDKLGRDSAAHCTCGLAYRQLAPLSLTFNVVGNIDFALPQQHCRKGTIVVLIALAFLRGLGTNRVGVRSETSHVPPPKSKPADTSSWPKGGLTGTRASTSHPQRK